MCFWFMVALLPQASVNRAFNTFRIAVEPNCDEGLPRNIPIRLFRKAGQSLRVKNCG